MISRERAEELLDGTTAGPWRWFGNTAVKSIYLATVDRGRIFVMRFFRWGMQDATPAFNSDMLMVTAPNLVRYEVAPDAVSKDDPRLYRHDFNGIRHPDAELIAAAPELAETVVALYDRIAKLEPIAAERNCVGCGREGFIACPECPSDRIAEALGWTKQAGS